MTTKRHAEVTERSAEATVRSADNKSRHVLGRWLYAIPVLLLAIAGWTAVRADRASSHPGPAGSGLNETADLKRFHPVGNGLIEDAATGIRRPALPDPSSPSGDNPFADATVSSGQFPLAPDLRFGVGPHPERLRVPSVGIDAPILPIGLDRDGALAVPERVDVGGWWSGGAVPGEAGPTVSSAISIRRPRPGSSSICQS